MLVRARAFAARVERELPPSATLDDQVAAAFRLAYGRPPGADDLATARAFVRAQAERAGSCRTALVDFCHVLLNSSEFLYVN
jgi:hypothetical protein